MASIQLPSLSFVLAAILAVSMVAFLVKAYQERCRAIWLKKQGFAMPPHHPIFGHLLVIARVLSKLPNDAHQQYLPDQLRQAYPDMGPIYYLDAWPFITLTLVVASPDTLNQITTEHVLPKFPAIRDFLYPLANGKDLVGMDGKEWKYWRSIFNPGFTASHLMTSVPDIVRETAVFCGLLRDHARRQDIFQMKGLTDNLAMDIVGKVVLDSNLDCQRKSNPMVNAFRRQIRWMAFGSEGNPLRQYHPFRPFIHWYNTYQMNRYISPEVDARYDLYRNASTSKDKSSSSTVRNKSIIDLTAIAYLKQNPNANSSGGIDPIFKDMAINQMKSFLFAGQDTTSSTICYVLYLISIHPDVLSRIRAEHDEVFGSDVSQTASKISENPYLLNKLPYTTATIKESMRLFPAVSSTRRGEPSFTITDPRSGLHYPADQSMLIWLVSHACHHDPAFWPRANEFLPERWLAMEGEELCPKPGAWRPFELGPRACVGKELSFLELKILLALVARRFELTVAYKELDAANEEQDRRNDVKIAAIKTVDGERAYQVGNGEPSAFLPCRVREVVKE